MKNIEGTLYVHFEFLDLVIFNVKIIYYLLKEVI